MKDAPEYNIATLIDIVRIPEARIPAFLAELPRLLNQLRPLIAFMDAQDPEQMRLIAKQLIWVDDGITDGSKDETTITVEPMHGLTKEDVTPDFNCTCRLHLGLVPKGFGGISQKDKDELDAYNRKVDEDRASCPTHGQQWKKDLPPNPKEQRGA